MPSRTRRLRERAVAPAAYQEAPGDSYAYATHVHGTTSGFRSWSVGMATDDEDLGARFGDAAPLLGALTATVAQMRGPVNRNLVDSLARVISLSDDALRAAFVSRAVEAIVRLTPELDANALGEAVSERSDFAVLIRALQAPGALDCLSEKTLLTAQLRDLDIRKTIQESEGGLLKVEQVARLLGITRQAIDKRRKSGRLLALPIGSHRYGYPAWQFQHGDMLGGFESVLAQLSLPDPWSKAAFFLDTNSFLNGKRPLDELRQGNPDQVRRAAWAMGEHGAA